MPRFELVWFHCLVAVTCFVLGLATAQCRHVADQSWLQRSPVEEAQTEEPADTNPYVPNNQPVPDAEGLYEVGYDKTITYSTTVLEWVPVDHPDIELGGPLCFDDGPCYEGRITFNDGAYRLRRVGE